MKVDDFHPPSLKLSILSWVGAITTAIALIVGVEYLTFKLTTAKTPIKSIKSTQVAKPGQGSQGSSVPTQGGKP